jgi:hypothetical protein
VWLSVCPLLLALYTSARKSILSTGIIEGIRCFLHLPTLNTASFKRNPVQDWETPRSIRTDSPKRRERVAHTNHFQKLQFFIEFREMVQGMSAKQLPFLDCLWGVLLLGLQ